MAPSLVPDDEIRALDEAVRVFDEPLVEEHFGARLMREGLEHRRRELLYERVESDGLLPDPPA